MMMTAKEHAAVTADHLMTFMAQVGLGDARMDKGHLMDLLQECTTDSDEQAFVAAALVFIEKVTGQ